MKIQWQVVAGIALALLIAIFAVGNTESVAVNFLVADASWPLILIILGCVLIGCLIMFCLNIAKVRGTKKEIQSLQVKITELERKLAAEKQARERETLVQEPLEQSEPVIEPVTKVNEEEKS
ncbi:LapA family protein [Listeria costaricensis]|uniref:LapA family protein n=1 Tax=Listeria costaricensis TaxID=2026604 RepID=UPI000C08D32A|nr:lipopolysaccharide assembly protein LapA domain-containing protein [Listeria costaricensis]